MEIVTLEELLLADDMVLIAKTGAKFKKTNRNICKKMRKRNMELTLKKVKL